MAGASAFGSAAWTGGEEYGGEYTERIDDFLCKVNTSALLSYASSLRGNRSCTLSREFSVGNFNLVRKLEFEDGVSWIARLRMPSMPDSTPVPPLILKKRCAWACSPNSTRWTSFGIYHLGRLFPSCLTLNFHRQNTDIPIPRVYGYDLDPGNSIGCPFSLLEYIHGNTAEEVSRHYPGDHEGVPAQFEEKFWRQIAKIMIQLGSIRLSRIGSIIRDGSGSFVVGSLVETGSGPYGSAAEFYADYPVALKESFGHEGASGQDELIQAFTSLAASFGRPATP
jgi:hypothetical protein